MRRRHVTPHLHDSIRPMLNEKSPSLPGTILNGYIRSINENEKSNLKKDVIYMATFSRVFFLIAMSLSCMLITPLLKIVPGDDVLTFDMRLLDDHPPCFCRKGDVCDLGSWTNYELQLLYRLFPLSQYTYSDHVPSISFNQQNDACALILFPSFWKTGSVLDSKQRSQHSTHFRHLKDLMYHFFLAPLTRWDAARFLSIAVRPTTRNPWNELMHAIENNECFGDSCDSMVKPRIEASEQAHAFLPLLPRMIRLAALFITLILPAVLLPSTFEAVAVLAALLINTTCFIGAAYILQKLLYNKMCMRLNKDVSFESSIIATTIFCFNPASVFFTASYSESVFSFLTFAGYYFADCWSYPVGTIIATIFWSLASYCRSNGILASGYILLHLLMKLWKTFYKFHNVLSRSYIKMIPHIFLVVIFHLCLLLLISFPLNFHDIQGFRTHCNPNTRITANVSVPDWCEITSRFSLYAHVQRKYWNVGLFRYYEWKQLPNFFLALPILYFGFQTVHLVSQNLINKSLKYSDTKVNISQIYRILQSITHSILDDEKSGVDAEETQVMDAKLLGREWTGHAILLAVFCFLGVTVAHIQISTRLICSSCPIIYVRMAQLYLYPKKERIQRHLVLYYLILFNVLGIILHPNWLPWT